MQTETMLDPRSRPTTTEERAKAYALKNPTRDVSLRYAVDPMDCYECEDAIAPGDPVEFVALPEASDEATLLALFQDDDGVPFVPHCGGCSQRNMKPRIDQWMLERKQCGREARLEVACAREANGDLGPEDWFAIMEANLGYCSGEDLTAAITTAVEGFMCRFHGSNEMPRDVSEAVRARLWGFVPMKEKAKTPGDMRLTLEPVSSSIITVKTGAEPGAYVVNLELNLKAVVR